MFGPQKEEPGSWDIMGDRKFGMHSSSRNIEHPPQGGKRSSLGVRTWTKEPENLRSRYFTLFILIGPSAEWSTETICFLE